MPASTPSHDEIAQCARELWTESGQPEGRDQAIWIEAERRLISERRLPLEIAAMPPPAARQPSHLQTPEQRIRRSSGDQRYVM